MPLHVKDQDAWKKVQHLYVKREGVWTPVRRAFVNDAGVWRQYFQDEVTRVLNATGAAPVAVNSFTPEEWANPLLNKRLVIPAGQEIGTSQGTYALAISGSAQGQAGSFAGDLIIDNYGTVSGLGGAPNSGVGGTAVWGNLPGRDGRKAILNNHGVLRGGGGGGGRGGNGGTGYTSNNMAEGPYFDGSGKYWDYVYAWNTQANGYLWLCWGGALIWEGAGVGWPGSSIQVGPYIYYRSADYGSYRFSVGRYLASPVITTYPGGAGGSGGKGQGYDGPNTGGAVGAAGSTNAGAGGTGGWGMHYGGAGYDGIGAGLPGAAGAAGNYSGGSAGASGGAAGFYLNGLANITFNNFGTVQGRIA